MRGGHHGGGGGGEHARCGYGTMEHERGGGAEHMVVVRWSSMIVAVLG